MANGYKPGDYFRQFLNQLPQMYYAKKNSELQRERFEYYKTKDAEPYKERKRLSYTIKTYSLGSKFKDLPLVSRLGNSLIL